MIRWSRYRGIGLFIALAVIFVAVGMIIGSNLSIPDKLQAIQPASEVETVMTGSGASATLTGQTTDVLPGYGHSPFVAVAEKTTPAVVNISAESISEDKFHTFMDDEFFKRFFGMPQERNTPEEPRQRRSESMGSGFIISADGYVLTNNHVVKDATKVTVTLSDQKSYKADVVGMDNETDLAVLKIKADESLPTIKLGDSDSILVGDWVMAVGNPFPNLGLDRTITVGVVSAKGRKGLFFGDDMPSFQNYIQTDASINPGNSGGPLLNLRGEAIGVNSAIATPSGGNVGIGFAIPINLAKRVADQLMASGTVSRGYLGIFPQDITPELKEANGLESTEGIIVAQVDKDTPADKAALKVGDVVVKFNGQKVLNAQQFRFLVADAGPNADISLDIWRNGDIKTVKAKLGDRAKIIAASDTQVKEEKAAEKWLGLEVQSIDDTVAREYNIEKSSGVVITGVKTGSASEEAGLRPGDVILKISGREITNSSDYYNAAENLKDTKKAISFYVKRGRSFLFVAVNPEP